MKIETIETGTALAREQELLEQVSREPAKRFLWAWQGHQSLVVPRKLSVMDDFASVSQSMSDTKWPVFVRGTGGDVTPQGAGIVNITHVYAAPSGMSYDVETAYDHLCGPIERALGPGASRGWQPGAFCDGAHNVQWNGRKFAGTALRFRPCKADRSRRAVLAHALMLFQVPTEETILALNSFLSRLGQNRVIKRDEHAALSDDKNPAGFLENLTKEFDRVHALISGG